MSAVLLTPPVLQFFTDAGAPLINGKLYTYVAGSVNSPKATFTDASGLVQAQNPVVLDSAGRATVWISGAYKFVLTDSLDNVIRVTDNVTSFTAIAAAAPSYFQSFSGNGSQTVFNLSTDLGTDENAIFAFVDNGAPNQILNGDFATDTVWTKGAGWSIAAGVATATGAISTAISQAAVNIPLIAGQLYIVTYTVTRSAGTITPNLGGTDGVARALSGTYTEAIIVGATQALTFNTAGFTGTLDNVVIKAVQSQGMQIIPPTAFVLTSGGTPSITFASAPQAGTNNILLFAPSLLVAAASASADAAQSFANAASASAAVALNAATSLQGTSTTSNTIGSGTKSFTTQTGKNFAPGAAMLIASAANVSNFMSAVVQTYNTVTGALSVTVGSSANLVGGAGTIAADWILSVSGVPGVAGTIGSGTADMKSQIYVATTNFTPGVSTQLTLTNTPIPASASALFIDFDANPQHPTEWSLNVGTGVITFNSAIPVGTSQIYAYWFKDIAVGTPTDGTVTYLKMDSGIFASAAEIISGTASKIINAVNLLSALPTMLRNILGIGGFFESAQQTITAAGTLSIAHSLPQKPKLVKYVLQCTTADAGYSVGDEITETLNGFNAVNCGVTIIPDAANIVLRYGSAAATFVAMSKAGGVPVNLTNANWRFVVRAWA